MRKIEVPFIARIKLTGILQSAPAGVGGIVKLTALSHVYEAIRFTEEEHGSLTVTNLGPPVGMEFRITDPVAVPPDSLTVTVSLEDEWVTWFGRTLDEWVPHATVADLTWFEPLRAQLSAARPEPKMVLKRRPK